MADGSVDLPKLLGHVNHLLRAGCDGVTLFGTCGEGASFSVAERKQVLAYVVKAGVSPRKLLVATYACALPDAVELTRHATAFGVYGVMFIPPFYFSNPTDDGVVCPLFFAALFQCTEWRFVSAPFSRCVLVTICPGASHLRAH